MDDLMPNPDSPEGRATIEAARAQNKAKATEALRREVVRYAPQLLPQAVDRIVEIEGRNLAGGDPGRLSARVFEWMGSAAADRYRKPETVPVRELPAVDFGLGLGLARVPGPPSPPKPAEPRSDALRQALSLFASDFKTPALLEKFYNEHALTYSHRDEAAAVEFVAGAMADRKYKAYQKSPIPPSERVRHVASLMKPWAHQLKTDEHELAESWPDLVDPLRPAMPDLHIERTILVRLSLPHNAQHLKVEEFDPTDARSPRAGGGRPEAQQQQRPAAEPTWAEANAEQFRHSGGL